MLLSLLTGKAGSVDSSTTDSYTGHRVTMLRQSYQSSGNSPAVVPWVNRSEEIMKSEIGPQEFDRRMQRQTMLFEVIMLNNLNLTPLWCLILN